MPRQRNTPAGMRLRGKVYYAWFRHDGRHIRKRLSHDLDAAKELLIQLKAEMIPPCRREQISAMLTRGNVTSQTDGTIYFIQDVSSSLIKIGWTSKSVDSRLKAFRCGNPGELRLLGTRRGTKDNEWFLHQKFREDREAGEWFNASDGLLNFIDACTDKSTQ